MTIKENIPYAEIDGTRLTFNLQYEESKNKNRSAMIVIHGGGWEAGSTEDVQYFADFFAKLGFVVFNINYRLTGTAPFPAQIEDCKTVVRYVRANADKYGINGEKIGAFGVSAGGHLAALLGVLPEGKYEGTAGNLDISSSVTAVINYIGPVDFPFYYTYTDPCNIRDSNFHQLFDRNPEGMEYWIKEASPITHVSADTVPFITLYGSADDLVPHNQGFPFHEKMKKMGAYSEFYVEDGSGHGLSEEFGNPKMEAFCRKFLL